MAGYFRKPPAIVPGLLMQAAEAVWRDWNPLIWVAIKKREVFGGHFHPSGDVLCTSDDGDGIRTLGQASNPGLAPVEKVEVGRQSTARLSCGDVSV